MPASDIVDLSKCAVHTMTHQPWTLQQCCEAFSAAGIGGITVWRNVIEPIGTEEAARIIKSSGLKVPALARGGFFPGWDAAARQKAVDENKQCVDEAAAIGAEMVVLVVGALPGMALAEARMQVAEGLAQVLPHAEASGVKLAIEPLHPMYAATRSCVNRMAEAREICEHIDSKMLGIAIDVYHVWWDPELQWEIDVAAEHDRLFAFHVCDWKPDMNDMLNDRGLPGEGCIDIKTIRSWIETTGFSGFNEVEIFSNQYWAMDQQAYLDKLVTAYRKFV